MITSFSGWFDNQNKKKNANAQWAIQVTKLRFLKIKFVSGHVTGLLKKAFDSDCKKSYAVSI